MIPEFVRPHWLLLAPVWLALVWRLTRHELAAFRWLDERVGERFRTRYTSFSSERAVRRRGWCLAASGALLAVAAAGPSFDGELEVKAEGSDVVVLLDASQSMYATDVDDGAGGDDDKTDRFTAAVEIARRTVEALPDHRFAIFTFSGAAAPEMAMTGDRVLIEDALFHAEPHTVYESPGSSFAAALDVVLPFTGDGRAVQALIISDGEQPFAEDFEDPLAALEGAGVPVHAVTVGTAEGQSRVYDDVAEDEREFRVDFTTRRVDRHLYEMSDRTGGVFAISASYADDVGSAATVIAKALGSHPGGYGPLDRELASEARGVERGRWALGLFLLLFAVDAVAGARRRRPPTAGFDLDRLGGGPEPRRAARSPGVRATAALLVASALSCTPSALERAHRENERGLAFDSAGAFETARTHFERSRAFAVRAHIPTHNLGRTLTRAERYGEAHDFFEEAMRLDADFLDPYYGDGVALFSWGESERDPEGCVLERTQELWQAALGRFEAFEERAPKDHPLVENGTLNAAAVRGHLTEIEALIEEPPPSCESPPPPPPSPNAGSPPPPSGDGDDGPPPPSGDESEEPPPPSGGAAPPPPPPSGAPPPPSPAGLSPDERKTLDAELERILADSRADGVYHRRTGQAHWTPGRKATEKLWW